VPGDRRDALLPNNCNNLQPSASNERQANNRIAQYPDKSPNRQEHVMGFEVYDYRSVNRNVLVTPEIRARLYHMKPGQVDRRHSHDLGHEVFLILEGRAEFEINGTRKELGPGQMCIALADEIHQVRNLLPDRPTIMYLSVTPHIHPTHTGRDEQDGKLPPVFNANPNYDDPTDLSLAPEEL
jgi:quercetin dioxygenase-like cupin family protein